MRILSAVSDCETEFHQVECGGIRHCPKESEARREGKAHRKSGIRLGSRPESGEKEPIIKLVREGGQNPSRVLVSWMCKDKESKTNLAGVLAPSVGDVGWVDEGGRDLASMGVVFGAASEDSRERWVPTLCCVMDRLRKLMR